MLVSQVRRFHHLIYGREKQIQQQNLHLTSADGGDLPQRFEDEDTLAFVPKSFIVRGEDARICRALEAIEMAGSPSSCVSVQDALCPLSIES